jgi:lincosamide nucleotidyltransferase A/C/D/E
VSQRPAADPDDADGSVRRCDVPVELAEVVAVLAALVESECPAWVGGGWGVDALVGHQTRPHRDLDLAIDARGEPAAIAALDRLGYHIQTDWRPVRLELSRLGGSWVDLHPVIFDSTGHGRQQDLSGGWFDYPAGCLTIGCLDGLPIRCLSVDQQIRFHTGYPPRDIDRHDLALLHQLARQRHQ